MAEAERDGRRAVIGALGVLGLVVAAWLWPIGLGGRMPVGGDVTQFSIGLMAELARALRAGRLPVWNDLWGYGFPGVGESQMGVFYPPHWLLYGLLPLEAAYTASLTLHTFWGAAGTFWASRRMGTSAAGALVAGVAWSGCGFFLIHLSHQWGYTCGSWMPWVWGLAWLCLKDEPDRQAPYWLAVALTLQLLPGHYQLAFETQLCVAAMAAWRAVERATSRGSVAGPLRILAALAWALPLGALQLWPTWRVARLAAPRRDFEYLSGFAATPLHLVSFIAPGLFERSPLWRPIVWDPLHTSPEEYLAYVGLAPLFLAVAAVAASWRRSAAVRLLAVVAALTLLLALGPYVPGFRVWSRWPGFSFFRAPARWTLATSLALSLLAGLGLDALPGWAGLKRGLAGFAVAAVLAVAGAIVVVEGAIAGDGRSGPGAGGVYSWALDRLPWGEPNVHARLVADARRPNHDARVAESLARQGVRLAEAPRPVFVERRWTIYRDELAVSAVLLGALVALGPLARRPRWLQAGLIALTIADLEEQGRHRRVDLGPVAPLTRQSPVLAELARRPRGTRVLDPLRNLPMVAGVGVVSAYRTLDLPALDALTALAGSPPSADSAAAARLTGARVRILDPGAAGASGVAVPDPALAGWLFGADLVAQSGPRAVVFRVGEIVGGGTEAWLVPLTPERSGAILGTWSGKAGDILAALTGAEPLELRRREPGTATVDLTTEGPALVLVSRLADPQWEGVWTGPGGERPALVRRAFGRPGQGAWQAVEVPGPGRWTLRLRYRAPDVLAGLSVSVLAAAALGLVWIRRRAGPTEREGERA